jgi:hypothetical protein
VRTSEILEPLICQRALFAEIFHCLDE